MPGTELPFEIHITVQALPKSQEDQFAELCKGLDSKPLLIELQRGEHMQQPMLSKIVYAKHFDVVLKEADDLSHQLNTQHFPVKRLKIEVPANKASLFDNFQQRFEKYFEWHGKVSYTNTDKLLDICKHHHVHLSLNALKNDPGHRFITLREFGEQSLFNKRIEQLKASITSGNWLLSKEQFEYCIYDNNAFLDNGWLSE